MKKRTMRILSMIMAVICLTAMMPSTGLTAYAAVSDSDISTSGSDLNASDSDVTASAPVIKTQPTDANIVCGENAVFTIEAEGEGLTYQWYLMGSADSYSPLRNCKEYLGTDTAQFTIVSTKEYPENYGGTWSDTYFSGDRVFCRVTNEAGSVDSNIVVFSAAHNDDRNPTYDIRNHWGSCTCSIGETLIPQRYAHTFENNVCTECGMSSVMPRLAGTSRCDTAAVISSSAFETAENVVLTSGNDYADALAGVPLAYALDAPILLVRGNAGDSVTINEIARLGAKNIYILGGTVAVSQEYEDTFKEDGYNVTRIAGNTRFDTCVKIAEKLAELTGNPEEVFFAASHNFPDALAISGIAAVKGSPILYVAPSGVLNEDIASFVSDSGAVKATVLGGSLAIGDDIEKSIADCGIGKNGFQRLYGTSRYDTNLKINEAYADVMTTPAVCVATGANFPDALAGGVLSAIGKAPILLVGDSLNDAQKEYLPDNLSTVVIFGGVTAVSESIAAELAENVTIAAPVM